jgi:hypothetical protein
LWLKTFVAEGSQEMPQVTESSHVSKMHADGDGYGSDKATPAEASLSLSSPEAVFEGLRDFQNLSRERALQELRTAIEAKSFEPEKVEPLIFAALQAEAWEAKQGGLLAAAEVVKSWDRPEFRNTILCDVPRLLTDAEYRVRKAVAAVLIECCRRDGLAVYDRLSDEVLGDIHKTFQRPTEAPDEQTEAPPIAIHVPVADNKEPWVVPTFLHDTEGWRSLETSMGALEAMMQGCGIAFTPRITADLLGLLRDCSRHTNRFVREYAYFAMKSIYEVCDNVTFLGSVGPDTVDLVRAGILDNWSQVRYAASTAARAFMTRAGEQQALFFPKLLGPMCLNRHYVAEGVKLYSQETWRFVCGPQGGARLLVAHLDSIIATYIDGAEANNHAVREAACHCISELAKRVAGSPSEPTPYREHFTSVRVLSLLKTLMTAFEDESWPVRDVSSTAIGYFVRAFPEDCESYRDRLVDLWFDQMCDNIPSMRHNGAAALAMAVGVWPSELWSKTVSRFEKTLPEVMMQSENSTIFQDYAPSGPFSVAKPKPIPIDERPENPINTDQMMFSCGSMAPKTFKRRQERRIEAGGCMNCTDGQDHQLWEASEGMVHLLAELTKLAKQDETGQSQERLDKLAASLPNLARAFDCSQFRHHYLLKQRICERLPAILEDLGPQRCSPSLPELTRIASECAKQNAHANLKELAKEALAACHRASGIQQA